MNRAELRVAIVGMGPRGIYALERLIAYAGTGPESARIRVVGYEPHPSPGAGAIYDPSQAAYLRMNFAAEMVDMWSPREPQPPISPRPSFEEWRVHAESRPEDDLRYPPRAEVGAYLSAGLRELLAAAPDNVTVQIERHRVERLTRGTEGWSVRSVAGDTAEAESGDELFDEVLLCTGHLAATSNREHNGRPDAVASAYTEDLHSTRRVPGGSTIAVRGMALSFIDAALTLTEGRGGSFSERGEGPLLDYVPSDGALEPGRLLPYSRSGRLMAAKPDPDLAASLPDLEPVGSLARKRLLGLSPPLEIERDLCPLLVDAAANMLAVVGSAAEIPHVGEVLDALLVPGSTRSPSDGSEPSAREMLRRSILVGAGLERPDSLWALGECWRSIYPALIERAGREGLDPDSWPAFRSLAREMERIAFGPPLTNAAKLLALIDAGLIDLSFCHDPDVSAKDTAGYAMHAPGGRRADADLWLDAVSPPPGALHLQGGPIAELLADGWMRIPAHRRGIETAPDGACIGSDGRPVAGLAAIGRLTEDWVVGNDTLNRRLHPQTDNWARSIAGRAVARSHTTQVGAGRIRREERVHG